MLIGILAIPEVLPALDFIQPEQIKTIRIKNPEQLQEIDGLILAGNNIGTLGTMLRAQNLATPIRQRIKEEMPLWGLGAGLYLVAKEPETNDGYSLELMDIIALENSFPGRFEAKLYIQAFGVEPINTIFDHGPGIKEVEPHVGIMANYQEKIVMARQGNLLVSAFFPAIGEGAIIRYFLNMVQDSKA